MDRSEVYPIVFIITFLGIYSIIIGSVSAAFVMDYSYNTPNIPNYHPDEGMHYAIVYEDGTYNGESYYNVSHTMDDFRWQIESTTDNYISTWIGYSSEYVIEFDQNVKSNWSWLFGMTNFNRHFTAQEIINAQDDETGISELYLNFNRLFRVQFIPHEATVLPIDLTNYEDYTITLSESLTNYSSAPAQQKSGFDIILNLITYSLPNMNTSVQFLLAFPIQACLAYLTFRVLLMFIPFISGGA